METTSYVATASTPPAATLTSGVAGRSAPNPSATARSASATGAPESSAEPTAWDSLRVRSVWPAWAITLIASMRNGYIA